MMSFYEQFSLNILRLFFIVLARRLKNRPDRDDLVDRNIIPGKSNILYSYFTIIVETNGA